MPKAERTMPGTIRVRISEQIHGGDTSYRKKPEQACGLHQDKVLQRGWPNVNVGSRVFSFSLGWRGEAFDDVRPL